ncbi:MAG: hypothetical protein NTU83_11060, partial [Candidatus Hydrogenedentes bacterium]|nr:hypothetical protein [Candidatus Hydrogenedentota bacterium]
MHRFSVLALMGVLLAAVACADEAADKEYIARFDKEFPKAAQPAKFEDYATVARYDELFMGGNLDNALKTVSNDSGGIAWDLSYRMMSLNDMYRVTGDVKYLRANLRCIQAVLAVTDDKIGKQLFTGRVVAAWGCDKYAKRGRAVFAVHTGIITAPMFEFLLLARDNAGFKAEIGDAFQAILKGAVDALAVHDRQWRDGPEAGAGHYIGMDQEDNLENKPLPGNRLSAMGWALWRSWQVSDNTVHRDRALAIGRYIKNRLYKSPDGAYYWAYWLTLEPVTEERARENVSGEDSSHAGLTMALPLALARDGQVFTPDDLKRVGKMVLNGIARLGGGILIGSVTGDPKANPGYVGHAVNWLSFAEAEPGVRDAVLPFYLNYKSHPSPYELARLLRFLKF